MTVYIEDNRDEYSTRDEPAQPSFYKKYGHDERDGPPEEGKYVDDAMNCITSGNEDFFGFTVAGSGSS